MTPLTDTADRTGGAWAPPAGKPERPAARVLADPRVRLGAGAAALLVTAVAASRNRVGPGEAAAFRAVNDMPGWLYPPAWVVMQLGVLGAAPAAAGAALLAGDRELAGRLLAGGTSAWALSKVVKHFVRRPRPAGLLPGTRLRGREPAGLGYLSGHAGVAVALGAAAFPRLGPGGRALTLAAVPVVGLTRIYVGAHLPLDVVGGAALGVVIDAAYSLVTAGTRAAKEPPSAERRKAGRPGAALAPTASPPGQPYGDQPLPRPAAPARWLPLPPCRAQAVHDADHRDREDDGHRSGQPDAHQQLNDPHDNVRHACHLPSPCAALCS